MPFKCSFAFSAKLSCAAHVQFLTLYRSINIFSYNDLFLEAYEIAPNIILFIHVRIFIL